MAATATLALVAVGLLWVLLVGADLRVGRRIVPVRLFHGSRGTIELTVRNVGRLTTNRTALLDGVPDALGSASGFVLEPLGPGRRQSVRYEVAGHQRGVHAVGPATVLVRDPFGLATRPRTLGGVDTLTVYPPVTPLDTGLPLHGRPGTGSRGRRRPGTGGDELAGVREYVHGDDLRRIHWRATAHRGGDLMVRLDEAPGRPGALLVLDVRSRAHRGSGPRSSLETAVGAAASIARHVATQSVDVALAMGTNGATPRPLPWEATLEQLAAVEADPSADLAGLWRQLASGGGRAGALLAVTCVPDPGLLRAMVRAGRGAGVRGALLVDADAHGRGSRRGPEPGAVARALRSAGWHVAVIGPDDDLRGCWRQLLADGGARRGTT